MMERLKLATRWEFHRPPAAHRRCVVSHAHYACRMIVSENRYPLFGIMR